MASDHTQHGHDGTFIDTLMRVLGILAALTASLLWAGCCGLSLH